MKVPQRVIWSEGMFMSPQHLQQLDRYHEGLIEARLGAIGPYIWGVVAVEIDERALVAGQVRVVRFEGVLPDGMPVAFDGTHPEAPAIRPIENHFPANQRVLEVFLAMPAEREGSPMIAAQTQPTQGMRFFTAARPVVDAAGGAADVSIAFAQRHVQILFGDESRDDYEAIKIAEILRDGSGALVVRQEYIPPLRRIGASPWLMGKLRNLLQLMAAKYRSSAEKRRQREDATVEFTTADVTNFLKLSSLSAFLPIVNHLAERVDTPPEEAYLMLSQLAGQLTTFVLASATVDADPMTLPKFIFTDLGGTFNALIDRIIVMLGIIEKERYVDVPLTSREDGLHFGRLDDERLIRGAQYILTVRTGQPERVAADQIPGLSKIASWSDVSAIVQSALPGVSLQVTYRPPPEIPPQAGTLYFMLTQNGQFWTNVNNERTIAIYLPPPYDPASIKLALLAIPKAATAT